MNDMDPETMENDDPVMQAVMERCKGHMESMGHDPNSSADSDHHGDGGGDASQHGH